MGNNDSARVRFVVEGEEKVEEALASQQTKVKALSDTYDTLNGKIVSVRDKLKALQDFGGGLFAQGPAVQNLSKELLGLEKSAESVGNEFFRSRTELEKLIELQAQANASQTGRNVVLETPTNLFNPRTAPVPDVFSTPQVQKVIETQNAVRKAFSDDLNTRIKTQQSLVEALGNKYKDASVKVQELADKHQFLGKIASTNKLDAPFIAAKKEADSYKSALDKAAKSLRDLNEQQDRFNKGIGKVQGQSALAGGFSQPFTTKDQGSESLLGRFDRAAKAVSDTRKQTQGLEGDMKKLQGASLLTTSILTKLHIPGAEAISVIFRQFAEEGLTLKKLLDSPTFTFGIITAGVIGLAAAMRQGLGVLDEYANTLLRIEESAARVTLVGQRGGESQITSDLRTLEQAKKDFEFFIKRGDQDRAQSILRQAIGGGADEEEFRRANNELEKLFNERKKLRKNIFDDGLVTIAPPLGIVNLIGKAYTDIFSDIDEKIKAGQERVQKALGGQQSPELFNAKLKENTQIFNDFQQQSVNEGRKDNIFEQARESLRGLAEQAGRGQDLNTLIDRLLSLSRSGSLLPSDAETQINNFKKSLEGVVETERRAKEVFQDVLKQTREINHVWAEQDKLRKSLQSLDKRVETNPLIKQIKDAKDEFKEFQLNIRKFGDDGVNQIGRVKEALGELVASEVFKFDLSERLGVNKLKTEIDKLTSFNLFPNTRQIQDEDRDRLIIARIREAREKGDFEAERLAKADFVGRATGFDVRQQVSRERGEFVKEAEIQNERLAFDRAERVRFFSRNALDEEFGILENRLKIAKTPDEQRLVLDRILEASSNISELTSSQRDFRIRALQQRLSAGEAERHRVLIEIKNSSEFAKTRVNQILGEEPSPTNQTSEFSEFGAGAAGVLFGG